MTKVFIITLMLALGNGKIISTSITAPSCRDADVKQAVKEVVIENAPALEQAGGIAAFSTKCQLMEAYEEGENA